MNDSMLLLDIGESAGALPDVTPAPTVYGCWFPVPHQATPVPTVSGLTATPVADGILLEWDAIDLPDVVYVIERATSESGPWIELARTPNPHYLVSDPSGDTWFFRVIARVRGRAGGERWVEGSSKVIAGDEDIAELIGKQQALDEAQVLDKVELIDLNAEELIKEILRSHAFNDISRNHADTLNRAVTDIALLVEDGQVTAQQVTDLFAQLEDETSTRQVQYQQLNEAIVDETSARASAMTGLHAQVTTEIGNTSAALNEQINTVAANANSALASATTTLGAQIIAGDNAVSTALQEQINTVEANANSALASTTTTLGAQITAGDNAVSTALQEQINTVEANANSALASTTTTLGAQITAGDNAVSTALQEQINTVAANADSALATAKTTLGAQITAGDNAVSTALHTRADEVEATAASARTSMQATWAAQLSNTQALLQSSINTKVTANQAEAIAQTQVQAFQNGTYATLVQSFNVIASEHDNMHSQWSASWGVKLTGGTFNGQPIVASISLSANPNTGSDFIIQSNNFYVISPNASDGLELRNGYLRVFRGSAQRIIGNGFGQGSQLVDYFGPNVGTGNASKTNAVMWMDTSGNAGFNGIVSAGKVVGGLQQHVAINWTGEVDLIQSKPANARWVPYTGWRTVTDFTLPAPPAGEQHVPLINLMIGLSDRAGSVFVQIEHRNTGGTWAPYWERSGRTSTAYLGPNDIVTGFVYEQSVSLQISFPRVGHEKQFRIRVRCLEAAASFPGGAPVYHHTAVTSVIGTVIGLR